MSRRWVWLLAGLGVLGLLGMIGLTIVGIYAGIAIPNTAVYQGDQVPARFITTMQQLGALDEDETIHYFYSDGFLDIQEGFYFVSDRKVGLYNEAWWEDEPFTKIEFHEIVDCRLDRNRSFIEDSEITLELADGYEISFPVSSEQNRDQEFFDAIRRQVDRQQRPDAEAQEH